MFLVIVITIVIFIQKFNLKKAYIKIVEENVKFIELKKSNKELEKRIFTITDNLDDDDVKEKYKSSTLSSESKSDISNKIINAIEKEKLFKNVELKIIDLAEHLDINRTYISQVLTEDLKINFKDLVNNYRVEEAKELLADEANSYLTISAIAEMSGFKPSTFNRVFKNKTGVTPSFFMKNAKKIVK